MFEKYVYFMNNWLNWMLLKLPTTYKEVVIENHFIYFILSTTYVLIFCSKPLTFCLTCLELKQINQWIWNIWYGSHCNIENCSCRLLIHMLLVNLCKGNKGGFTGMHFSMLNFWSISLTYFFWDIIFNHLSFQISYPDNIWIIPSLAFPIS